MVASSAGTMRRASRLLPREFHQVVASGALRLVGLPVSAVFAMATIHLLIARVGVAAFGIVSLITSISTLLPFADLGVGAAVVNAVAKSDAPHEDTELSAVVLTSLRVLCASGVVVMCLAVVGAFSGAWSLLLGAHRGGNGGQWAVAAAIAMFGLSLPLGLGQRILLGSGRSGAIVILQCLVAPSTFVLVWILGAVGVRGVFYALCAPMAALLVGACSIGVAARATRIPVLQRAADLCRLRSRRGTSVRRTAAPMVIITLGIPLALQTDRIVLAHRSSLEALAHYAVAIQLYAPLWAVIASAGSVLWPIFARRRASNTEHGVSGPLLGFTLAGCAGAFSLVVAGPWVAHLATGSHLSVDRGLFLAFGALLLVQAVQLPIGMFLMTEAGLRFQAACVTCMVPVSLIFSWWAAAKWGATGPVLGSIVAVLVCQWIPGFRRARASSAAVPAPSADDLALV